MNGSQRKFIFQATELEDVLVWKNWQMTRTRLINDVLHLENCFSLFKLPVAVRKNAKIGLATSSEIMKYLVT